MQELADFAKELSVRTAILDRFGMIVAVNEQWKRIGKTNGLTLREYGIGENYLRHCAFADPLSPRIISGLSKLLSGEINWLSIAYSGDRDGDHSNSWSVLLAFPHSEHTDHFVVMHIDITILVAIFSMYREGTALAQGRSGAHLLSLAAESMQPANSVVHTILDMVVDNGEHKLSIRPQRRHRAHKDSPHRRLSRRQLEVFVLTANGKTDAEIAAELGISVNTVKAYIFAILDRLGFRAIG